MADSTTNPLTTETDELPKTKEKLDELSKAASIHYTTKNYPAAAEAYANALEIQAELNGELAPVNAELLFYYGRALYKVAVAKSDVLGNKVAQEDRKKGKARKEGKVKESKGDGPSAAANRATVEGKEKSVESKPYFQLTGDENWTDSEEEDEDDGVQEEDEDDFGNAYETFELARVLYSKQLETLEQSNGTEITISEDGPALTPQIRALKERIADCHGFLVEISLENERFHDAISDARASLALQSELHPFEHENVTEGHYSLSLALEFASVSKVREDQSGQQDDARADTAQTDPKDGVDWTLRTEAAEQTNLAIQSLEGRLAQEEAALTSATLSSADQAAKRSVIADKRDMLSDLRTRLTELKADPTNQEYDSIDQSVFQGLLGGLLGKDAETQKEKIKEATKGANDVSGLVRTKKKAKPEAGGAKKEAVAEGNGKRKLEVEDGGPEKRAKTEEPA